MNWFATSFQYLENAKYFLFLQNKKKRITNPFPQTHRWFHSPAGLWNLDARLSHIIKVYPNKNSLHSGSTGLSPQWNQQHQTLKTKKSNPNADAGELEREIDEKVYELYRLNEKGIEIMENLNKSYQLDSV